MTPLKTLQLNKLIRIIRNLPDDLRAQYLSEELANTMEKIQQKHEVEDEAFSSALKVTGRTMIGMLPVKDFIKNLSEYADLSPQKAQELAQDINEQAFQSVRESLMEVHGLSNNKQSSTTTKAGGEREPVEINELEEKEKNNTTQKEVERGANESIKDGEAPEQKAHMLAEQRRKELIERLKKSHNDSGLKNSQGQEKESQNTTPSKKQNGEVAGTQTAWNGKTIDLRKVPPRREKSSQTNSQNREWEENGVRYLDPRDLV